MTLRDQLRAAYEQSIKSVQRRDGLEAVLGNQDNVLRTDDMPSGYVYARVQAPTGIAVWEVRCTKVTPQVGLPVILKQGRDGVWEATEQNPTLAPLFWNDKPGGGNVGPHGGSHWHLGADPVLISPLQVERFRTHPTSPASLSVGVSDYLYWYDGEWLAHADSALDLTAKVPAATVTTQRIIIVGLDKATNTLATVDGEERFVTAADRDTMPFTLEDVRALLAESAPEGFEPSAAVRLYGGQTAIRQVDIFADAKISGTGSAASSQGNWDPDLPPVTPSAMDDEFDDDSFDTGLWTEFDSGAIQAIAEAGETLVLSRAANATAILTGIRQALPAGSFTFAIKVQVDLDSLDGFGELALAGLVLWENATGDDNKAVLWGMGCKGSGAAPLNGFALAHWTGHDDLIAVPSFVSSITAGQGVYLRARYNAVSNTFKFDYSTDGETWSGGGVADTPPDFTPAHIGIGLVNRSGDAFAGTFDFFRYRARFDTVNDPVYGDFGAFRDEKAAVSAGDTTPGYLGTKLVAGTGIDLTVLNPGGDETLEIAATGGTTDDDAIHDNQSGEIAAITEKASPASGDWLLIEDSEAANVKKAVQIGNLPGGTSFYNTIRSNFTDKTQRQKIDFWLNNDISWSVTDQPVDDATRVAGFINFLGATRLTALDDLDRFIVLDWSDPSLGAKTLWAEDLPFIKKSVLDANSILKADADDTPAALTVADNTLVGRAGGSIDDLAVAEGTLVGRKTGGNIDDLAAADVWDILGLSPICQGRLSLSSALPVPVADITAAGTLYFHPFKGNRISLYDGTRWTLHTIPDAGISLSLSGLTINQNYDVFIYDNAGTLTLEALAWSSHGAGTSTRATALAMLAGVEVKSGATTRRYLGSFRTIATGQCEDSEANRFLWNRYNQTWRRLHCRETTINTWNGGGWRAWNGNTTPGEARMQLIVGLVEHYLPAGVTAELDSGVGAVALGVNVTDAQTTFSIRNGNSAIARGGLWEPILLPQAGYHWINVVQNSNATTNFRAVEANINVSC
jgi:hypothetical protein